MDKDHFILTPGNHDIQKSTIDEILEAGFHSEITNREKLNQFIDDLPSRSHYFSRLENFHKFKETLESTHRLTSTVLYSTYTFDLHGTTIGVASLNSSWRASGKGERFDHGKLLLGERQIDHAAKEISGCDIRVAAIHHPFEWLADFDMLDTRLRALAEFDLLLFGHNHKAYSEVVQSTGGTAVINNCGCLYGSREYHNGYTVITYNMDNNNVRILYRTYFDSRRKFDTGIDVTAEGGFEFSYDRGARVPYDKGTLPVIAAFNKIVIDHANKLLVTARTDSIAPKDLRQIFVEPPLSDKPEKEGELEFAMDPGARLGSYIRPRDIIDSARNCVIVGKKESGKTTLLRW